MSAFIDSETLRREREAFALHAEPIKPLLDADDITDIILCTPRAPGLDGEVWVDRNRVGLVDSGIRLSAIQAEQLIRDIAAMGQEDGEEVELNERQPRLSCQFAHGQYRFECVIPPAALGGPTFVIRKYLVRGEVTLADYVADGTLTENQASWLLERVSSPDGATVLIGGETGSGKTTLLHPLVRAASVGRRVILIEDTPELETPAGPTTRLKTIKSFGYQAAIISSLRQRPNLLVLGEMRGPDVAQQALEAWTTGHRGLGTLHAGSCREMMTRIHGLCCQSEDGKHITVSAVASAIQAVVHLSKRSGHRVAEVMAVDAKASSRRFVLTEVR
jgi:type IV secretion system protein VirB11